MAEYALIVSADLNYLCGINALLNSLDFSKSMVPVHILTTDIPKDYQKATQCFNYPVVWHNYITKDPLQFLLRKRFVLPAEIGVDAVCILDADMFVLDRLNPYLEIADKTGYILGCGQEQKRKYNEPEHMFKGKYIIDPELINLKDICAAPLFVGKKWYETLSLSAERYLNYLEPWTANDMDALNITLVEQGADKWIISLPQQVWTGLHESMLKLHSRAVERHDRLFTDDGQQIMIVHGRYWQPEWIAYQMWNQKKMIDEVLQGSLPYNRRSYESMQILVQWWNKMNEYKLSFE